MKKLPAYLGVFFILFVVFATVYFAIPSLVVNRIETVLQDYETTKDPEPVRAYLFARREAEGMTARIQFVTWGREHQEGFLAITDTFDRAQTGRECDLLAFVMTDSGQDDDFEAAFRNYESKCLEIIRSKIAGYRSIQK